MRVQCWNRSRPIKTWLVEKWGIAREISDLAVENWKGKIKPTGTFMGLIAEKEEQGSRLRAVPKAPRRATLHHLVA